MDQSQILGQFTTELDCADEIYLPRFWGGQLEESSEEPESFLILLGAALEDDFRNGDGAGDVYLDTDHDGVGSAELCEPDDLDTNQSDMFGDGEGMYDHESTSWPQSIQS